MCPLLRAHKPQQASRQGLPACRSRGRKGSRVEVRVGVVPGHHGVQLQHVCHRLRAALLAALSQQAPLRRSKHQLPNAKRKTPFMTLVWSNRYLYLSWTVFMDCVLDHSVNSASSQEIG